MRGRFTCLLALVAALLFPTTAAALPIGPLPVLTVGLGVPAAPQPVALPNFAAVKLNWAQGEAGAGPILRYSIYRGPSPLLLSPYATVDAPADGSPVTYVDRSADLGATYYYAVTATNAVGESERSPIVSASPTPVGTVFATAKWTGKENAYDIALLSGGTVTKLSQDDGDHQTPAVAPDGSAIAYTSNHGNDELDYDLWLQRPGAEPVRLTSGPDADGEPAFSPDGRTIAFTRLFHGQPSVWVVSVDGGEARRVPGTSGHANPSWAPSGRMLVVAHVVGMETALVVTDLDGTVHHRIEGTISRDVPAFDPSFSPDGTTLSFVRATPEGGVVATVPVAGGTPTELTKPDIAVASQQWAPAGDRIVFEGYSKTTPGTLWSVEPGSGTVAPLPGGTGEAGLSPAPAEAPMPYVPLAAPGAPAGVHGTLDAHGATLHWARPPGAPAGTWYLLRRSSPDAPAPVTPDEGTPAWSGESTSAHVGGLEPGRRYHLTLFAVSPVGDVGAMAVRGVTPAGAPVVTTQPGEGPAFTASWSAAGAQAYEAQVGVRHLDRATRTWSAPAWRTLARGPATVAPVAAAPGQTYYVRARALDTDGNATGWGRAAVVAAPYDDRAMTPSGHWADVTKPGRYAGTLRSSSSYGSELRLRAWGSSYALIADRCPGCGLVEIYVDGEKVATVDTYAKKQAVRQVVWSASFSRIGRHEVTVRVAGTGPHRTAKVDGLVARR